MLSELDQAVRDHEAAHAAGTRCAAATDELRQRGHSVIAPDLPGEDDAAGLCEYADAVVDSVRDRTSLTVVAHSFAGFSAPLVSDRLSVEILVLVAPMISAPGESPGEWWDNTGHARAQRAQAERDGRPADEGTADLFLHDVPPGLAAEALRRQRDQSGTPSDTAWPLAGWPEVPTYVAISRPRELVERLEVYAAETRM